MSPGRLASATVVRCGAVIGCLLSPGRLPGQLIVARADRPAHGSPAPSLCTSGHPSVPPRSGRETYYRLLSEAGSAVPAAISLCRTEQGRQLDRLAQSRPTMRVPASSFSARCAFSALVMMAFWAQRRCELRDRLQSGSKAPGSPHRPLLWRQEWGLPVLRAWKTGPPAPASGRRGPRRRQRWRASQSKA